MSETDIALFDMDGTLVDYVKKLKADVSKLTSPSEGNEDSIDRHFDDPPDWMLARMRLVKSSEEWWASLPRFQLGFDIWNLVEEFEMRKMILTQCPKSNPAALAGKMRWIESNLGENIDFTMTRDKGLVYGKILVDDWPPYVLRWLEWRPRGLVVMPASDQNVGFSHPQVIRYDGTNLEEVREALKKRLS